MQRPHNAETRWNNFYTNTMSTPQITLTDCLAEVNNALNYWYPLKGEASQAEHDARHVRLFQFRDRLQQQLRAAGKDAAFDLAMAMAELANVAAERDKARLQLASLQSCLNSAAKSVRESEIAANTARQSLRAAEADAAETESVNSDLRTVNARLVAERDAMQTDNGILRTVNLSLTTDLRAATQRADTAEAILRAKA